MRMCLVYPIINGHVCCAFLILRCECLVIYSLLAYVRFQSCWQCVVWTIQKCQFSSLLLSLLYSNCSAFKTIGKITKPRLVNFNMGMLHQFCDVVAILTLNQLLEGYRLLFIWLTWNQAHQGLAHNLAVTKGRYLLVLPYGQSCCVIVVLRSVKHMGGNNRSNCNMFVR